MPNLSVRNIASDQLARLKMRAARHGRSTEAEVREIIRRALDEEPTGTFEELAAQMREMLRGRTFTPPEVLIRESRGER